MRGRRRAVGRVAPGSWRIAYRWEGVDSLEAMYTCAPMADAVAKFLADRAAGGARYDVAHVHHLTGLSVDALASLRANRLCTAG